jgi:osmoprotectant transport system substrate-binding protein
MEERPPSTTPARWLAAAVALVTLVAGCGSTSEKTLTVTTTVSAPAPQPAPLPGAGRPAVTIGDKNFTEQFVLGQLYAQALKAEGYSVTLNPNIGPTEVTVQALRSGSLSMYPEYLNVWNTAVARDHRDFRTELSALRAARQYALAQGDQLLNPTPFSDTQAIAVQFNYGVQNRLTSIGDLAKVASTLSLGGPPQFQQEPSGLPAITAAYSVVPATFKALEVGQQYAALDQGTVQAAAVNTTDGQLITGNYTLLDDPLKVFGWGNAVPVVPLKVLAAEGPQFAATINRVSALLTMPAIRQLNAAVDIDNETPQTAAAQFLQVHGLIPAPQP